MPSNSKNNEHSRNLITKKTKQLGGLWLEKMTIQMIKLLDNNHIIKQLDSTQGWLRPLISRVVNVPSNKSSVARNIHDDIFSLT